MLMEQVVLDHNKLLDDLKNTPSPEAMLARHDYSDMGAQELCWALSAAELRGSNDKDLIEVELAKRTYSYTSTLDTTESARLISELNNYIDGYKNTHASFDEIKQLFQEDDSAVEALLIEDDDFMPEADQPTDTDDGLLSFWSPRVARVRANGANNGEGWLSVIERVQRAHDEEAESPDSSNESVDEPAIGWKSKINPEAIVETLGSDDLDSSDDLDKEEAIEALLIEDDEDEAIQRPGSRWQRFRQSARERRHDFRHGKIWLALNGREATYNFPERTTMQKLGEKAVYGFLIVGAYGVWNYKDALK